LAALRVRSGGLFFSLKRRAAKGKNSLGTLQPSLPSGGFATWRLCESAAADFFAQRRRDAKKFLSRPKQWTGRFIFFLANAQFRIRRGGLCGLAALRVRRGGFYREDAKGKKALGTYFLLRAVLQ